MKKYFLILIYIIIFTFVSLILSQLPSFINDEPMFQDKEEVILCLFAGIASGIIVGFFSTESNNQQKDR